MITVKPSSAYGPKALADEQQAERRQAYKDMAEAIQELKLAAAWLMGQLESCSECDKVRAITHSILQAEAQLWALKDVRKKKGDDTAAFNAGADDDFRAHTIEKLREAMLAAKDGALEDLAEALDFVCAAVDKRLTAREGWKE